MMKKSLVALVAGLLVCSQFAMADEPAASDKPLKRQQASKPDGAKAAKGERGELGKAMVDRL
ncbi:MAG: hypothetical protein EHM48_06735, partial [Planctomycetaceae bacterium]